MFRAGTPWKLWLLSATVTWGILATVDLAENTGPEKLAGRGHAANNGLHRRAPSTATSQDPISVQCGNSFNNPDSTSKIPDGAVACTAYGGLKFACYGLCEVIIETPEKTTWSPFHKPEFFTFGKCEPQPDKPPHRVGVPPRVGGVPGHVDVPRRVDVYPDKFWAHNRHGVMLVEGSVHPYNPKVGKKQSKLYLCPWKKSDEINNQRPWCRECYKHDFKQAPEPIRF